MDRDFIIICQKDMQWVVSGSCRHDLLGHLWSFRALVSGNCEPQWLPLEPCGLASVLVLGIAESCANRYILYALFMNSAELAFQFWSGSWWNSDSLIGRPVIPNRLLIAMTRQKQILVTGWYHCSITPTVIGQLQAKVWNTPISTVG